MLYLPDHLQLWSLECAVEAPSGKKENVALHVQVQNPFQLHSAVQKLSISFHVTSGDKYPCGGSGSGCIMDYLKWLWISYLHPGVSLSCLPWTTILVSTMYKIMGDNILACLASRSAYWEDLGSIFKEKPKIWGCLALEGSWGLLRRCDRSGGGIKASCMLNTSGRDWGLYPPPWDPVGSAGFDWKVSGKLEFHRIPWNFNGKQLAGASTILVFNSMEIPSFFQGILIERVGIWEHAGIITNGIHGIPWETAS